MDRVDNSWNAAAFAVGHQGAEPSGGTERRFIAAQILERADVAERQARIAGLVSGQIIPRLMTLHYDVLALADDGASHPTAAQIARLAELVLSADPQAAANYVVALKQRGLSMDVLFVELLEPAARHLGEMWDRDECDFIDVTLGVGRLQKLLAVFNCTYDIPAIDEKRSVLMMTVPGEAHGFGIGMVQKFLEAGGWQVRSEQELDAARLAETVADSWFAVAGLTLSNSHNLPGVADAIATIRRHSCNPAIGVMVGGPIFNADPALVHAVGADATAASAPTAVIMAQRLFDIGVTSQLRAQRRS